MKELKRLFYLSDVRFTNKYPLRNWRIIGEATPIKASLEGTVNRDLVLLLEDGDRRFVTRSQLSDFDIDWLSKNTIVPN